MSLAAVPDLAVEAPEPRVAAGDRHLVAMLTGFQEWLDEQYAEPHETREDLAIRWLAERRARH